MDIGGMVRGAAPFVGIAAGTAAVGAAATYATVRAAGESDGGTLASLGGILAGKPIIGGGLVGVLASTVLARTPLAQHMGRFGGLLLIPAAIGGAMAGASLARRGLERAHPAEYDAQQALIDSTMGATQEMFRRAGADEQVLERVPERYDRSYFNASYQPPLGPFGDEIIVGRSSDGGRPYGDDVIAHEFAHKVIHEYAPTLISPTPGDGRAIHESLADTFAMAVDTEDWLVAEDSVDGGGRSFSHPEVRGAVRGGRPVPAPITRAELESDTEEHLGAGVGNKAAWRIGNVIGREELARLYVAALERDELGAGSSYADLAGAVRAASVELYGAGSAEAQLVDDAWRQAGY